ncbi:MAG TPA: TIGR03790 family protein [Kiritimatiellia bacterium]|nr:TIGR03790 family protein [Kiritimatiellia bacterium]
MALARRSPTLKCGVLACGVYAVMPGVFAADRALRERDAAQTVVIANQNHPASLALARHYMHVRGIPETHLCVLDLPTGETMARRQYERRLRDPLLAFLREQDLIEQVKREDEGLGPHDSGWRTVRHRVRYVVSMMGVPLRIAETRPFLLATLSRLIEEPFQRDAAAVDSELALVLWDAYEIKGFQGNPQYNLVGWSRAERQPRPILMAARLDGPDADTVRRMMDDTMFAERYGLYGRAYIDTRNLRDPDYLIGDFWLREAGERWRRYGMDVVIDRQEDLFPEYFPMEDVALYFGWYAEHVAGPFLRPGFRFRTGAVAYHLHSTSAETVRRTDRFWAGPLLAAGAAAVMGSVYEPYLLYTPDLQVFADRLASGFTLGESAYLAQRALSWQNTVIGDPLYRPFAYQPEERLRLLEEDEHPNRPWEQVRWVNLLADQQQVHPALAYAREAVRQSDDPLLREKLADLYAKNENWAEALPLYRRLVREAADDVTAARIGYRLILLLRLLDRPDDAAAEKAAITSMWPGSPFLRYLEGAVP